MEFPSSLIADEATRAGRMLAAGDVRVTVTRDEFHSQHITIRFKAIKDNRAVNGRRPMDDSRNWIRVPLAEATHVFIEVPNASGDYADKVGTFYPRTGKFYEANHADHARVDAAIMSAHWFNNGMSSYGYQFREESYCGTCGKTLTDPVSIDRGVGPECYRQATGSQHQIKNVAQAAERVASVIDGSTTVVNDMLGILATLTDGEQDRIYRELAMWQSQRRDDSPPARVEPRRSRRSTEPTAQDRLFGR